MRSSAASDVYKRQGLLILWGILFVIVCAIGVGLVLWLNRLAPQPERKQVRRYTYQNTMDILKKVRQESQFNLLAGVVLKTVKSFADEQLGSSITSKTHAEFEQVMACGSAWAGALTTRKSEAFSQLLAFSAELEEQRFQKDRELSALEVNRLVDRAEQLAQGLYEASKEQMIEQAPPLPPEEKA